MCTRYWMGDTREIREIAEEMERSPLIDKWNARNQIKAAGENRLNKTSGENLPANPAIKTKGEVRPTDIAPVIAPNRSGIRTVFPMKWGYTGRSLLVNARAETAAEKPTFREDWARHRCIVPASEYFEWEHRIGADGKKRTGDKYIIRPKQAKLTFLCGLYRIEEGLPVFVILTREPGEEIRFIHDRMPLILPEDLVNEWLRPDARPEELLPYALTEMEFQKAEPAYGHEVPEGGGQMTLFEVPEGEGQMALFERTKLN